MYRLEGSYKYSVNYICQFFVLQLVYLFSIYYAVELIKLFFTTNKYEKTEARYTYIGVHSR